MIPKAIRRASLGHMGMPRPLASGECDITNLPSTANAVHVAVFHDPFRYPPGGRGFWHVGGGRWSRPRGTDGPAPHRYLGPTLGLRLVQGRGHGGAAHRLWQEVGMMMFWYGGASGRGGGGPGGGGGRAGLGGWGC